MNVQKRTRLLMVPDLSDEPEIARWLWALEDTRRRTKDHLDDLPAEALDWFPAHSENSIGTLLYHIALIEADWLYVEVLEQPYPPFIAALFPHSDRDTQGQLSVVAGVSLAEHIMRLDTVRRELLQAFRNMPLHDFRRVRHLPEYDVSPEWVLHHLMQHEAEHRGQITALRDAAADASV